jgi:hypothetical protein
MFALSAGPGAYQVWLNGVEASGAYWMMVGVPATATSLFLLLSALIPDLLGDSGLRFPLQISLPVVFTALLPTCAALWMTTPEELVSSFEVTRFARVWEQPGELLIAMGAQILGLFLLGVLRRVQ